MIEGAYARAGLLSDVEVIDDYPSRIAAYSKRKHRWVRGDWQILFWLFPRVPDYSGSVVRNPINLISRWKILDNLRRSLTEISMLAILISGWLFLPGKALYWTLATLGMFVLPGYLQSAIAFLRSGGGKFTARFWKEWFSDFAAANAHLLMRLVCLPQQSMVTLDAIIRAGVRMAVTRRKLLEWETAAEAESSGKKTSPVDLYLKLTPWLAIVGRNSSGMERPDSFVVAWPLLFLWAASEAFSNWLDQPLPEDGLRIGPRDEGAAAKFRAAHLEILPRVQQRKRKLPDSGYFKRGRRSDRASRFDDQPGFVIERAHCGARSGTSDRSGIHCWHGKYFGDGAAAGEIARASLQLV